MFGKINSSEDGHFSSENANCDRWYFSSDFNTFGDRHRSRLGRRKQKSNVMTGSSIDRDSSGGANGSCESQDDLYNVDVASVTHPITPGKRQVYNSSLTTYPDSHLRQEGTLKDIINIITPSNDIVSSEVEAMRRVLNSSFISNDSSSTNAESSRESSNQQDSKIHDSTNNYESAACKSLYNTSLPFRTPGKSFIDNLQNESFNPLDGIVGVSPLASDYNHFTPDKYSGKRRDNFNPDSSKIKNVEQTVYFSPMSENPHENYGHKYNCIDKTSALALCQKNTDKEMRSLDESYLDKDSAIDETESQTVIGTSKNSFQQNKLDITLSSNDKKLEFCGDGKSVDITENNSKQVSNDLIHSPVLDKHSSGSVIKSKQVSTTPALNNYKDRIDVRSALCSYLSKDAKTPKSNGVSRRLVPNSPESAPIISSPCDNNLLTTSGTKADVAKARSVQINKLLTNESPELLNKVKDDQNLIRCDENIFVSKPAVAESDKVNPLSSCHSDLNRPSSEGVVLGKIISTPNSVSSNSSKFSVSSSSQVLSNCNNGVSSVVKNPLCEPVKIQLKSKAHHSIDEVDMAQHSGSNSLVSQPSRLSKLGLFSHSNSGIMSKGYAPKDQLHREFNHHDDLGRLELFSNLGSTNNSVKPECNSKKLNPVFPTVNPQAVLKLFSNAAGHYDSSLQNGPLKNNSMHPPFIPASSPQPVVQSSFNPLQQNSRRSSNENLFKVPAPPSIQPLNKPRPMIQSTDLVHNTQSPTHIYVNGKPYRALSGLGIGGSSVVYQVIEPKTSKLLAIKCVDLKSAEETIAKGYLNEVAVLEKLQGCQSVIKMFEYEYVEQDKLLYVVMEKGETDLASLIKDITKTKKIPLPMVIYYWTEMLKAVKDIHDKGIIHSDLKPSNFLLVAGRLKLIDFGIASSLHSDSTSVVKDVMCGTFNYMSPEAIASNNGSQRSHKISYKSDVWSLGCILYNLVYGKLPYSHLSSIWSKLTAIADLSCPVQYPKWEGSNDDDSLPVTISFALRWCLIKNVKDRPTVAQLLKLPYYSPSPYMERASKIKSDTYACIMEMFPDCKVQIDINE